MSSIERAASLDGRAYALSLAARLSWRDFKRVYPPRIYLASIAPRAILQVAFLGYLGAYVGGESGKQFAFVGASAQIIVLATVIRASDVLIDERVMGTLHRLRLGNIPLPLVVAARWWVFALEGVADALIAIAVAGPLLGEGHLSLSLLAATPLLVAIAVGTSGLGLFVAAASLRQRADVVLTNLASYLLLLLAGVVAPISTFGPVGSHVVRLLPLTNGLLALRSAVDGHLDLGAALLEVAVGLGWAGVGSLVLFLQGRRARHLGSDEIY